MAARFSARPCVPISTLGSRYSAANIPFLQVAYRAPALISLGGVLMMMGGAAPGLLPSNQIMFLNLDNTTTGWRTFTVPSGLGPGPRSGHRLLAW